MPERQPDPRYETEDFRVLRPTTPGGDYQVQAKGDGAIVAVIRRNLANGAQRRWLVRPAGAPNGVAWTHGTSMMEVARHGYRNRRSVEGST